MKVHLNLDNHFSLVILDECKSLKKRNYKNLLNFFKIF